MTPSHQSTHPYFPPFQWGSFLWVVGVVGRAGYVFQSCYLFFRAEGGAGSGDGAGGDGSLLGLVAGGWDCASHPAKDAEKYEQAGNATVIGDYIMQGAKIAQRQRHGLALLHSHPNQSQWQPMSPPDREAEASYANLVREITDLPLIGMTLATADTTWSARHWNRGTGKHVDCTHAGNVRVVGGRVAVSWNDALHPPPQPTGEQLRTLSAWGEDCQADLARRRVLVVGAGSVGLDVAVRLAASGLRRITIMDFDIVEPHNLDRLIGAMPRDVRLCRPKIHVACREAGAAATAAQPQIETSDLSVCEPSGLRLALDHDLIFSCVDRPWPRAILNTLAYADLIPVIDGGIAIDTFEEGTMRNATWRIHVIRPGRPCMRCNRQLDAAQVIPDMQGLLDDPAYIEHAHASAIPPAQNVAPLSVSVSAGLLAQYVSLSVAPAGFGDPGPLQYTLNPHTIEYLEYKTEKHCPFELQEGKGDNRNEGLIGPHPRAEQQRRKFSSVPFRIRALRWIDDRTQYLITKLNHR